MSTKTSPYNPLTYLASLRLTVVLLAMSMYLIFVGTLAQVELGIWQVVEKYFRSMVVQVPFDVFRALLYPGSDTTWSGSHPFPGGFLILGALMLNLLAAHALRYKITGKGSLLWLGVLLLAIGSAVTAYTVLEPKTSAAIQQNVMLMLGVWAVPMALIAFGCLFIFGQRKAGIVLVHGGLILMLLAEFITGLAATEGQVHIPEFGSSNVIMDVREVELAFVSDNDDNTQEHATIPESRIAKAEKNDEKISDPFLPLAVRIDEWMPNSDLRPKRDGDDPRLVAYTPIKLPKVTGTEQRADLPSVVATLYNGEERVGRYLFTTWNFVQPVKVQVEGKTWQVSLRFKQTPLDYSLKLHDFSHDLFTGTQTARNFSSSLTVDAPNAADSRDAYIKMNHPLRYDGKAFFQSGFFQQPLNKNLGSILQVADNPGAWVPYLSCVVVTLGLAMHFVLSLIKYGRRAKAKA